MKTTPILLICLLACGSPLSSQSEIEVSPDGPVKTLMEARDAARQLRRGGTEGRIVVTIRGGTYPVDEPVALWKMDSNVSYVVAEGEQARFVGGAVLDPDWFMELKDEQFIERLVDKSAAKHIRVVDLRKHGIDDLGELSRHGLRMEAKDRVPPASLAVDGDRMVLARWPNVGEESPFMVYQHYLPEARPLKGYELKIQSIIDKTRFAGEVGLTRVIDTGGKARGTRDLGKGKGGTIEVAFDRMKHWNDIQDIYLDGILSSTWEWTYNQLESVDLEKRQIKLAYGEWSGLGVGESVRLPHFHFDNIPEELDAPGEYWIDRNKGLLYFYPPVDIKGPIVLSTLAEPMISVGNARNIRFEGLSLETGRNVAIEIKKCEDVVIDNCRVANFTKGGIDAEGKNLRVINSRIYGMGGFGIQLAGGNFRTLEPSNSEVVNCHIHDFGWDQKSQLPGVIVSGVGFRLAHNEIHDGTHFGIRIRRSNDVLVEFNEIYDLPKYHKFDGGAVYVYTGDRPECRGIVLKNNYLHDVPTLGLYPDNFSWGVKMIGNVFQNVGVFAGRAAINVNGGGECLTINNIMIDCVQMYWQGARRMEDMWMDRWNPIRERFGDGKLEKTPHRKYPDFRKWLSKTEKLELYRPASLVSGNLLYHPNHEIMRDRQTDELGIKDNSGTLIKEGNIATREDPGFVDYASGDFRLKEDAPVFDWIPGFKPIPFERIGRLAEPVQ